MAPRPESSRLDVVWELWATAGLATIQTRVISEERTCTDFDDFWSSLLGGPSAAQAQRSGIQIVQAIGM